MIDAGTAGLQPASGYLHRAYAEALSEFGTPRELPACGGWILERSVPGTQHLDGMGPYPLFLCRDWARLGEDVEALAPELVSLTLVTDPFAPVSEDQLKGSFDCVTRFKEHLVADLRKPSDERVSKHHRYYAQRAKRAGVEIERHSQPLELLDVWAELYAELSRRLGLSGIKRFSRTSFERQLGVPGAVMFTASLEREMVAAHIWYLHGPVAHSHLQASAPRAYDTGAGYALYDRALTSLADSCTHAILGSGAGADAGEDGLFRFKRGWATGTRPAYLCGRVLQPGVYRELSGSRDDAYFPAYRAGELT